MKKLLTAALLVLLANIPARTQTRTLRREHVGPPKPPAALASDFAYASPAGLVSRRTGLLGEAALGAAAGLEFRAMFGAAHIRSSGNGYFPPELYKTAFSLAAENSRTQFAVDLNSNSDRPFNSPSETDLGFNFSRTFSQRGPHAWLFGLNYSTRRTFARALPMPFLTYRYASKDFFFLFPFLARWQISRETAVSASYQPVKYFRASISWKPPSSFSAELEGGAGLEQFLPAGRLRKGEALYCQTSSVSLKPALALSDRLRLAAGLGWQFGGLYYTGDSYDDYHAKTRLGRGPLTSLSLKYDLY